ELESVDRSVQTDARARPARPAGRRRRVGASALAREADGRAGPAALGLDLAVLRLRGGDERLEQPARGLRHLVDGPRERLLVGARRLREAADLANVLERGVPYFLVGGRRLEVEERVDVSAHAAIVRLPVLLDELRPDLRQ